KMLKFLSMLRDSFREAVDGWVIYVMVAASALLILGVASVSYEPVDAQTAFQEIVLHFNRVYPDHGKSIALRQLPVAFLVTDVRKLNDAKSPQEGDYRFLVHAVDGSAIRDELKTQLQNMKAKEQKDSAPSKSEDEKKKDDAKKEEAKKDEAKKDEAK